MTHHRLWSPVAMLMCALPLIAHDGLDEQLAAATAAIASDPRNAGLLLRRSELHRLHGDLPQALADVARAQALGTLVSGIDRQRARILMDQQDYAGAFAAFSRHLSDCPGDGDARAQRARCAIRVGDQATAISDLDAACALLHQPDPDLSCQLAELLHAAGRTDEAIARLDAAIARDGAIPAFVDRVLAIERASLRFASVLARLEHLAANTGQTRWLVERGDLLTRLGRVDEAHVAYQEAAQALAGLPPARRQSVAIRALIARIDQGLAGLTTGSITASFPRTTSP